MACEAMTASRFPRSSPMSPALRCLAGPAHVAPSASRPRRRRGLNRARRSGRTCGLLPSICASPRRSRSSGCRRCSPICSGSISAKARWSTCVHGVMEHPEPPGLLADPRAGFVGFHDGAGEQAGADQAGLPGESSPAVIEQQKAAAADRAFRLILLQATDTCKKIAPGCARSLPIVRAYG
jgi:hypothetical protein